MRFIETFASPRGNLRRDSRIPSPRYADIHQTVDAASSTLIANRIPPLFGAVIVKNLGRDSLKPSPLFGAVIVKNLGRYSRKPSRSELCLNSKSYPDAIRGKRRRESRRRRGCVPPNRRRESRKPKLTQSRTSEQDFNLHSFPENLELL
jgi:hypothetical protein